VRAAVQRGYKSIIALPLISEGQTFGALGIYSGETDIFDKQEVGILTELTSDLAFGITAIRTRVKRNQAEEKLKLSEEKYRTLIEGINEIIFSIDVCGHITYISPAIERLTRYRVDEVIGQSFTRFIHPDDLSGLQSSFEKTLTGSSETIRIPSVRQRWHSI